MGAEVTAAGIAAGATILGNGANLYAQGRMNRKSLKYNWQMYERQRQDALKDWEMQNEYNSPMAQMQRFRDAGLNPNLIYGQTNEGATVRSSDGQGWSPRAPQIELDSRGVLSAYYDTQLKEANLRNMETMNTVNENEGILKLAQTLSTMQGTEKSQFELEQMRDLKDITIEAAKANLKKIYADTEYTLDRNEREIIMQGQNLKESAERILNMRIQREEIKLRNIETQERTAKTREETWSIIQNRTETEQRIKNMKQQMHGEELSNKLKQLDIDLKKKGVQPHDEIYWRAAATIIEQFMDNADSTRSHKFPAQRQFPKRFPGK